MPKKLTTMNVSMPTSMRDYVRERMEHAGFANASEYVRHLIRQDQARSDQLRALIEDGLRSGPGVEMTPRRRAAFRSRLGAKHTQRKESA